MNNNKTTVASNISVLMELTSTGNKSVLCVVDEDCSLEQARQFYTTINPKHTFQHVWIESIPHIRQYNTNVYEVLFRS
jgi:hypothetical protein